MVDLTLTQNQCPNCGGWGILEQEDESSCNSSENVEYLRCIPEDDFASTCGHRFKRKTYPDGTMITEDLDADDE